MAAQIGNLVNLSELSSTLGIAIKTVKEYLWYLEKTFILFCKGFRLILEIFVRRLPNHQFIIFVTSG